MKKLRIEVICPFACLYIENAKTQKEIIKAKPYYVAVWSENIHTIKFSELPDAKQISSDEEALESFKVYYDENAPTYFVKVKYNKVMERLEGFLFEVQQ